MRNGADHFSLREAAREVGVSANASYRHFPDKSSLLAEVAADGFAALRARMQQLGPAPGLCPKELAMERFKATGRAYVAFALENPQIFRLMFSKSCLAHIAGAGKMPHPTPYEMLSDSLDGLKAIGALGAEDRAGAELKTWALVHGLAHLVLDGAYPGSGVELARELENLLEFAVRGLCGP